MGGSCATYLCPVGLQELGRINAVGDRAAKPWHQVEDDWRLVRVLEKDLLHNIEENDEADRAGEHHADLRRSPQLEEPLRQRLQLHGDILENTHGYEWLERRVTVFQVPSSTTNSKAKQGAWG